MTDDMENELRAHLSQAYPLEPVPAKFVDRITALTDDVASRRRLDRSTPSASVPPFRSRRSWWVAASAAVVVAATATVIGVFTGSDHAAPSSPAASEGETQTMPDGSTTMALPTSEWTPGSLSLAALGSGKLTLGPDGCLHMNDSVVIWPQGYYAITDDAGTVVVYGPDGIPRAETGSTLSAGGGWVGDDPPGCVSGVDGPFSLQDDLPALSEQQPTE